MNEKSLGVRLMRNPITKQLGFYHLKPLVHLLTATCETTGPIFPEIRCDRSS